MVYDGDCAFLCGFKERSLPRLFAWCLFFELGLVFSFALVRVVAIVFARLLSTAVNFKNQIQNFNSDKGQQ